MKTASSPFCGDARPWEPAGYMFPPVGCAALGKGSQGESVTIPASSSLLLQGLTNNPSGATLQPSSCAVHTFPIKRGAANQQRPMRRPKGGGIGVESGGFLVDFDLFEFLEVENFVVRARAPAPSPQPSRLAKFHRCPRPTADHGRTGLPQVLLSSFLSPCMTLSVCLCRYLSKYQ
ncbi:hypothetical protein S40285_10253 [Stachybotrys chlorohalonatus IBT 40285]|uniref:Uncharacterized protein n=1 Tax=Stachybotrys chlorohalonatus (strain IBT 40285) TaxID=1283841 RepID=A0A084QH11_STAC4|nr:hypothetical protein S40285_10253 [Stachybotrys chlorohalonata IBT 40285]